MTADHDDDERARADAARLSKATERIVRNLTDRPSWVKQLSALFGTPPDIGLRALRVLLDDGTVETEFNDDRMMFRLARDVDLDV